MHCKSTLRRVTLFSEGIHTPEYSISALDLSNKPGPPHGAESGASAVPSVTQSGSQASRVRSQLTILILALVAVVGAACSDSKEEVRIKLGLLNLDYSGSGLTTAAKNDDTVAVNLFIKAGFDLTEEAGQEALEIALEQGHFELAELLVEKRRTTYSNSLEAHC